MRRGSKVALTESFEQRYRYCFHRKCIPEINRAHITGLWFKKHPGVTDGAKNCLMLRLVNAFIILKIRIRCPQNRRRSWENGQKPSDLSLYNRWRRTGTSLAAARYNPSVSFLWLDNIWRKPCGCSLFSLDKNTITQYSSSGWLNAEYAGMMTCIRRRNVLFIMVNILEAFIIA